MECHILASNDFPILIISKTIVKLFIPKTNEETFLALASILLRSLDSIWTYETRPKTFKWFKSYLLSIPNLFKQPILYRKWWSTVDQVNYNVNCIYQKHLRQLKMQSHTSGVLIYGFVHVFNNTILLWCYKNNLLHPNTICSTVLLESPINIFSTIVKPQTFYLQCNTWTQTLRIF